MQESAIEDASLDVSAIVAASRVLDPASLVPQSPLRRAVLVLASGLVGGLGLGLGLVLIYSVTTGRLRSRADVAAAMGLPVPFSTGSVSRRWRAPSPRQKAGLELLVDGFLTALPTTGQAPAPADAGERGLLTGRRPWWSLAPPTASASTSRSWPWT